MFYSYKMLVQKFESCYKHFTTNVFSIRNIFGYKSHQICTNFAQITFIVLCSTISVLCVTFKLLLVFMLKLPANDKRLVPSGTVANTDSTDTVGLEFVSERS
jgi:hypothetical protein